MITEDYVSFEIAKLLKEKGFGREILDDGTYAEKCSNSYDIYTGNFLPHCAKHGGQVNAPTLQMAMKWLREVHHLVIDIKYQVICPTFKWRIYQVDEKRKHTDFAHYQTYEEACEAAIKYCLESLI